ncbi:hypothetical protein PAXINDRAFT_23055, partial [Paxillus involutus ATCC 200175]
KGVFTSRSRAFARTLVQAGCSQESVGTIMQKACVLLGFQEPRRMARRTVQRSVLEGGVAANIQLAHEISRSNSLTISTDGTSHRHINYISRHVALKVPLYGSSESESPQKHVVRLLNVESEANHTSEAQVEGLKQSVQSLSVLYNASPLSARTTSNLDELSFTRKSKGIIGDHAADVKKAFNIYRDWKSDNSLLELGEGVLRDDSTGSLIAEITRDAVSEAGGPPEWEKLPMSQRDALITLKRHSKARLLGREVYNNSLTDSERRERDFFVRAGCCMHKELNSVKGGNAALLTFWSEHGLKPPILLANKDNAATLAVHVDSVTASQSSAEIRALEVSGRGAVKACSLAGAIFNHKDDKKGQQDTYRWFMETEQQRHPNYRTLQLTFPDTSNTRYQSHVDACSVLVKELNLHLRFLEFVRDKKEKRVFTHMEANVYAALSCWQTLTEMCCNVCYGVAVTYPYAVMVRGPGTENLNILELGGVHANLKEHIQRLIDNPDLVLSPTAMYSTGTLDGKPWRDPDALAQVHELQHSGNMPHLWAALQGYLKNTLTTWERFTEEYKEGGTIDTATSAEREAAWMPSTNDANEGALGSLRLHKRHRPQTSLHQYNALAQFRRNGTQAFMDAEYTSDDEQYGRKVARKLDSSGIERARRQAIIHSEEQVVEKKREQIRCREEKAAKTAKELDAATLLLVDRAALSHLTRKELNTQLELHRKTDTTVPKGWRLKKPQMLDVLEAKINSVIQ